MQSEIKLLSEIVRGPCNDYCPERKHSGENGIVECFKARLVILDNHQVEGINYTKTFTLVAKMVTVHTVLAVVAAKAWELHQMDMHNAFLHGDLHK